MPAHDAYREQRIDLAAAFRWFARLGMAEAVANHFSVAVSTDGTRFLLNPCHRHFSRITASELLLLDANDPEVLERPEAPDPTAWYLHAGMHLLVPHARCVMCTCIRAMPRHSPACRTTPCIRSI